MKLENAIRQYDLALCGEVAERTRATSQQRLGYLREHFGADRAVDSITASDLREWRAALIAREERYRDHPTKPVEQGGLSLYTVHSVLAAARRLFKFLHAEQLLSRNPAEQLRSVKVPDRAPKAISAEDREKLLLVAQGSARDYALIRLFADTGARVSAICGLRIGDIDIEGGRAVVQEKGGGDCFIFFGAETGEAVRTWAGGRAAEGWLFPGRRQGRHLTIEGVYGIMRRIAKEAGVSERFNPHAMRHALARTMLENGADLGTVSSVLNHKQLTTTHQFYARWETDELRRRKEKFTKI